MHTLFSPLVKRESLHRDETALCIKYWLPVPAQHVFISGIKNKVSKTPEV